MVIAVCVSLLGTPCVFSETPRDKVDRLQEELDEISKSIEADKLDAQSTAYGQTQEELEQAQAELQQWLTANSKVDFAYGGGVFAWPIPGYSRVSSGFGWRDL